MSDGGVEFRKISDEDKDGIRHQSYDLFLDCDDVLGLKYESAMFNIAIEQHGEDSVISFYRKDTI